jgi:hypothetical protein
LMQSTVITRHCWIDWPPKNLLTSLLSKICDRKIWWWLACKVLRTVGPDFTWRLAISSGLVLSQWAFFFIVARQGFSDKINNQYLMFIF